MEIPQNRYQTKSGELFTFHDKGITVINLGNIKVAGTAEYLEIMGKVGDIISATKSGRILVDMRRLAQFDITTRAASVNALPDALLKKAPYLLVAVIKSSSLFENMSMQAAISVSKPLSKKFLDGKMFDNDEQAMMCLNTYQVPNEFEL